MKKKVIWIVAVVVIVVGAICTVKSFFGKSSKVTMDLNVEEVIGIDVTAQTLDPVRCISINSKMDIEKLIEGLKSYSLKEIGNDDANGWEYYFRVKLKDGRDMSITFAGGKVEIVENEYDTNGELTAKERTYIVSGYKKEDFYYLFENLLPYTFAEEVGDIVVSRNPIILGQDYYYRMTDTEKESFIEWVKALDYTPCIYYPDYDATVVVYTFTIDGRHGFRISYAGDDKAYLIVSHESDNYGFYYKINNFTMPAVKCMEE